VVPREGVGEAPPCNSRGPDREERLHPSVEKAIGWRASLKSWGRCWLRRPRERLSTNDWLGKGGRMPVPVLTTVGFLLGGAHVLFGQHQHFRLGGALATSAAWRPLA
jgi:hypothetical protein